MKGGCFIPAALSAVNQIMCEKVTNMKRYNWLLAQVLLIFGFSALRACLQINDVGKSIISLCVVTAGIAVFLVSELRANYEKNQALYKALSVIFFAAANAFYCFAFFSDNRLHQHTLLYNEITAALLFPLMIISSKKVK